jgi:predicted transcriptional regulator
MDNILEQYRGHLAPIIYECLEQMYERMKETDDKAMYGTWKELIRLLIQKDVSVTAAFRICMMKIKEEYRNMILMMFIKYERNPMNRNLS